MSAQCAEYKNNARTLRRTAQKQIQQALLDDRDETLAILEEMARADAFLDQFDDNWFGYDAPMEYPEEYLEYYDPYADEPMDMYEYDPWY